MAAAFVDSLFEAAIAAIFWATALSLDDADVELFDCAVLVVMSCPPAVTNDAGAAGPVLLAAAGAGAAVVVGTAAVAVVPRLGTDAGAPVEPVLM